MSFCTVLIAVEREIVAFLAQISAGSQTSDQIELHVRKELGVSRSDDFD